MVRLNSSRTVNRVRIRIGWRDHRRESSVVRGKWRRPKDRLQYGKASSAVAVLSSYVFRILLRVYSPPFRIRRRWYAQQFFVFRLLRPFLTWMPALQSSDADVGFGMSFGFGVGGQTTVLFVGRIRRGPYGSEICERRQRRTFRFELYRQTRFGLVQNLHGLSFRIL